MEVIVPGRTVMPSSDGKATVSDGFMDTRMPASRPNILRYSDCSRNKVIFRPEKYELHTYFSIKWHGHSKSEIRMLSCAIYVIITAINEIYYNSIFQSLYYYERYFEYQNFCFCFEIL